MIYIMTKIWLSFMIFIFFVPFGPRREGAYI